MAWQTPKVNWQAADGVSNTDLNRIEGNAEALEANKIAKTQIMSNLADMSLLETTGLYVADAKTVGELSTNLTVNYGTCTTYSATATYALNALVIYNNRLYKCTTAITVAEAWNAAHWTAIADTNNGTVYNTTDSSFYGIRGADSVLKKLGSEPLIRVAYNQQFVGSTTVMSWNINPAYTVVKTGKVIVTTSMSSNQRYGSSAVYKNGVLQTYKYMCGSEGASTANFLCTKTYEIEVNIGDIIRVNFSAGLWGNTSDGRATMWASYEVFTI